jgi:zinc transport system ATP-binding protein
MRGPAMPRNGASGDTLLRLSGVTVRFGGRATLDRVEVEVRRGEIVTVIGPNGSGKTTLIRAALGLIAPDEGEVARRDGLRVGYVPQQIDVDRTLPLTVRRFLTLSGTASREDHERALTEVGVGDVLDSPFQALSGGEAKRVTLARALLRRPDLLVLDEPTSNVDVAGQAEFYDLIRTIRDRHDCGVLLVSHDLLLVMRATDTVVCLNGHVCCSGRPDSVSRNPEYLALFGPRVAETLGVYAHDHDHHHDLAGEPVIEPVIEPVDPADVVDLADAKRADHG